MDTLLRDFIRRGEEELVADRRDFHKHPELGWMEVRTASLVARRLEALGFSLKVGRDVLEDSARMGLPSEEEFATHYEKALSCGADSRWAPLFAEGYTAVVGEIDLSQGAGEELPVWAFRFDMDALPVQEFSCGEHRPSSEGFSSVFPGVMHACGHDSHVAVGLGVARALAYMKKESLCKEMPVGKVLLIFQPAEEGVRGARALALSGVLDSVDRIVGGHLVTHSPAGTLVAGANGFLATTKLDARFSGRAAHAGGAPEEGRNALLAACSATLNLHAIPRHSAGASRVTVGTIEGGTGRNVIPDSSFIRLETRGGTTEINRFMEDAARKILEGSALMYNVGLDVTIQGGASGGTCDDSMVEGVVNAAESCGTYSQVIPVSDESMGSEDFFTLLEHVQSQGGVGTYFQIGASPCSGEGAKDSYAHHHGSFDLDEGQMVHAVMLYISLLVEHPCGVSGDDV